MSTLNLVLTTLVGFSFSKLAVDGRLGDLPSMQYQLSNEIETSRTGAHSQSQLKGFQPVKPKQLGWQPLKIDSDHQTKLNQKREHEKIKSKKETVPRKKTMSTVRDVPRMMWVWNPLKQPKLASNLTKVGDLRGQKPGSQKNTQNTCKIIWGM